MTVNCSRGISTLMFLRLCWRAPLTVMRSIDIAFYDVCAYGSEFLVVKKTKILAERYVRSKLAVRFLDTVSDAALNSGTSNRFRFVASAGGQIESS